MAERCTECGIDVERLARDLREVFQYMLDVQSSPWIDTFAEREDDARLIDSGEVEQLPVVKVSWP